MIRAPFTPTKLYYKIGEVCKIVGVEAYVLRYWETEFPGLAPLKNKSGQRTYRPRDIELLLQIRKLLYEDGFTIVGARKQLGQHHVARPQKNESKTVTKPIRKQADAGKLRPRGERLTQVREELENILTLLDTE
jgi:DNA-binding transcriptional MerR regulator